MRLHLPELSILITLSLFAIIIAGGLLFLYYQRKISIIEILLFGFATQTYAIELVGPTITTLYIISFVFLLDESIRFVIRGARISRSTIVLLVAPLISIVSVNLIYIFYNQIFEFKGSEFGLVFSPLFFYVKQYLPLFAIGAKLAREAQNITVDDFYETIMRTAIFSCAVALVQYAIFYGFDDITISQLIGLKADYRYNLAEYKFIRVQGLCAEPKYLSVLLGIALPLFIVKKRYLFASLATLIAFMTVGQTFPVIVFVAFISIVICGNISSVRNRVVAGLCLIIAVFMLMSSVKVNLKDYYVSKEKTLLSLLLFARLVDRFEEDSDSINELMGIPLQYDLERPVVNYFRDNLWLLLSGYGPANSSYLPAEYWKGSWNYDIHLENDVGNHMNMRWLFYVSEFGLPVFLVLLFIFTNIRVNLFECKFYVFLLLTLFFMDIEPILIIMYVLLKYKSPNICNLQKLRFSS